MQECAHCFSKCALSSSVTVRWLLDRKISLRAVELLRGFRLPVNWLSYAG